MRAFRRWFSMVAVVLFSAHPCDADEIRLVPAEREFNPDYGTAEIAFDFAVENGLARTIHIAEVVTCCDCVKASADRREIPAGGRAEVAVVFDLRERTGTQNKVVMVKTDPEAGGPHLFQITANIPEPFRFVPGEVELERDDEGGDLTGSFEIRNQTGEPIKSIALKTSHTQVHPELEVIEPGERYRVDLSCPADRMPTMTHVFIEAKSPEAVFPRQMIEVRPPEESEQRRGPGAVVLQPEPH